MTRPVTRPPELDPPARATLNFQIHHVPSHKVDFQLECDRHTGSQMTRTSRCRKRRRRSPGPGHYGTRLGAHCDIIAGADSVTATPADDGHRLDLAMAQWGQPESQAQGACLRQARIRLGLDRRESTSSSLPRRPGPMIDDALRTRGIESKGTS